MVGTDGRARYPEAKADEAAGGLVEPGADSQGRCDHCWRFGDSDHACGPDETAGRAEVLVQRDALQYGCGIAVCDRRAGRLSGKTSGHVYWRWFDEHDDGRPGYARPAQTP